MNLWKVGDAVMGVEVTVDYCNHVSSGFLKESLLGLGAYLASGFSPCVFLSPEMVIDRCSSCTIPSDGPIPPHTGFRSLGCCVAHPI